MTLTKQAKYLHFSLHDVCPFHLARIQRAEEYFVKWGVQKVTYLLVPNFHHHGLASLNSDFLAFVHKKRPFEVEWVLHGEFHLEDEAVALRVSDSETTWKRKYMTGGEGEFLAQNPQEIRHSILRGVQEFNLVLGENPQYFIPPAWLYNEHLHPILKDLGFTGTEDHTGIYNLLNGEFTAAPVATWATRTWLRRVGSLIVCPALARMNQFKELLRVACHPHDFDYDSTIASIALVYRHSSRRRNSIHLRELNSFRN